MKYRSALIKTYLLIGLTFGGCLKNEDNTATGPKAYINIANFAINAPAINVSFDGAKFNSIALTYGNSTATSSAYYNSLAAGIKLLSISSGTSNFIDKNNALEAGSYYSLLMVDSFKNNILKTMYLKEDTTTIDTLAKARLLHLLPGKDTISAVLLNSKDTAIITNKTSYNSQYINSTTINAIAFDRIIKPGTYKLKVSNNNRVLADSPLVVIKARSLYSFIVSSPATGSTDPKILFWQNK